MARAKSDYFRLDNMRIAFAHNLLTPKKDTQTDGSVKLSFQASLLWPKGIDLMGTKEDGSALKVSDELMRLAIEAWGDRAVQMIEAQIIKNPLLDGDGPQAVSKKDGTRYEGFAGNRFIRASATMQYPPKVYSDKLGADGKLVQITDPNSKEFYSGCYVNAVVNIFTWENANQGRGMSFGIDMAQFAKPGDRLGGSGGGGADASKFLKGVPGGATASVPAGAAAGKPAGNLFA